MSDTYRSVVTEHAAWHVTGPDRYRVFALPDGGQWLITTRGNKLSSRPLTSGASRPQLDIFALRETTASQAPELSQSLAALGAVARFRTPDLWESIATAIIRQVIRAAHARRLYRNICEAYGQRITCPDGNGYALFPAAATVLNLHDEQFASIGMTFKRRPLRTAAEAYLQHGERWRDLAPSALAGELQQIPRIGPWTAGATVADVSNDFAYYPYADLAVRTWARRAAPSYPWPDDEQSFGRLWRSLAGDQLAPLTLLTLAWGSQHGDTG
jgi:DNA-3-methyladenine glycosylase II